jgi:hypothetical protein
MKNASRNTEVCTIPDSTPINNQKMESQKMHYTTSCNISLCEKKIIPEEFGLDFLSTY